MKLQIWWSYLYLLHAAILTTIMLVVVSQLGQMDTNFNKVVITKVK